MTYNFDPDKWYADELFLVYSKLETGEINQNEYDQVVETLDKKLEEKWKKLDGIKKSLMMTLANQSKKLCWAVSLYRMDHPEVSQKERGEI